MKSLPHFQCKNGVPQFLVNEEPVLLLSGQLHNSSSSSEEYMKAVWPKLKAMHMNTVIATASWELIEPEPGTFTFESVDHLIEQARRYGLKLLIIWFASWKNGSSTYIPAWAKRDRKTYFRCRTADGRVTGTISPLCKACVETDARAFSRLMRHLKEIDGEEQTVLAMQVENESGFYGGDFDWSEPSVKAFSESVPEELIQYLNRASLVSPLAEHYTQNGASWEAAFGEMAHECFMAYHFAKSIGYVAARGKEEYEKKLLTYPRTDSRFLTADMAETASAVLHLAAKVPPFDGCAEFFPDVSLLVNDRKVSDHHAIIPTLELEKADLSALPVGERNILLLVCRELLCAVAEPYVYEAVTATFTCGGQTFTAKGRHVLSLGWKDIDRIFRASLKEKPEDEAEPAALPDFTEGQTFDQVESAVTEHFTAPPKAYTEDTLLSAMENAGKEEIPDDAERKGLGTPATRAAILEKLVAAGFVERKGKSLIPTKAGINLVTVLPEALTSPMLTAEWEQKLTGIARGEGDPAAFMAGISDMARELVKNYSHISEKGQKLFAPERETVGLCPRCGKPVYEGKKNFYCSDRSCRFVLWKDDRFWTSRKKELTKKMAADLLKKGRTSVKGMWSEKKGAAYDAVAVLDDTGEKYVRFKLEFPKRKEGVNGKK